MAAAADSTIACPQCGYRNPLDADHCGLCRYVPPRATDSREAVAEAGGKPGTDVFLRPSAERARQQPGTATIRKPTGRIAKHATTVEQAPITDRITPVGGAPVLPTEILALRRDEKRKALKSTVYSTGRLIRYALVGVVALGAICFARETAYTITAFATIWDHTDNATLAFYSIVFGLPLGFLTAWHGGGTFRGLAIGGLVITFEPVLIGWLMGPGRIAAWSIKDLMAGLLAGFCVGLFIEIDR